MKNDEMKKILHEWRKYKSIISKNNKVGNIFLERNNPYIPSKLEFEFLSLGRNYFDLSFIKNFYNSLMSNEKFINKVKEIGFSEGDIKLVSSLDFELFKNNVFFTFDLISFPKNEKLTELFCDEVFKIMKLRTIPEEYYAYFDRVEWQKENPLIISYSIGNFQKEFNKEDKNFKKEFIADKIQKMMWTVHDIIHTLESLKDETAFQIFWKKYSSVLKQKNDYLKELTRDEGFNLIDYLGRTSFIQMNTPGVGKDDYYPSIVASLFFIEKEEIKDLEKNQELNYINQKPGFPIKQEYIDFKEEINNKCIEFLTEIYDFSIDFVNSQNELEDVKNLCIFTPLI